MKKVVRHRSQHCISRKDIDPDGLRVLYRLKQHGFEAYLVGGGARDLLLGRKPKDCDISTDASPNQIKKLFRNCFLIGRRFRLAHIRFGDKVIETSTFRGQPDDGPEVGMSGRVVYRRQDNTFGTPEEDAQRRDFTINGIFYDIDGFKVVDYVGGLSDLEKGIVRCIGDPDVRFREDPVRMVRAVRFASRLNFRIERRTYRAMIRHCREISEAPPARLLEEIYKLFGYQSGEEAFRLLDKCGLLAVMFPEIQDYLRVHGGSSAPLWSYLAALDAAGETPQPEMIFTALLYDPFLAAVEEAVANGKEVADAELAERLMAPLSTRYQIPKRIVFHVVRALADQHALEALAGGRQRSRRDRFLAHRSLPDALRAYELHVAAGFGNPVVLDTWQNLLREHRKATPAGDQATDVPPARRRRRRPRKRRREP